jgi:hypothetical protein
MTIFDLLLIAVVLASTTGILTALVQAVRGKFRDAGRILLSLACGLAIYVATICIVSLSSKQQIRNLGDPDCSDDWCVTPEEAHFQGPDVTIEFKVWSRAKRVTQREYGVNPYLLDASGRRFDFTEISGPSFDQSVAAGESFTTERRYRIDREGGTLDLHLRGGGWGPGNFVIGDSASLLHPRTIYRLKPSPGPV